MFFYILYTSRGATFPLLGFIFFSDSWTILTNWPTYDLMDLFSFICHINQRRGSVVVQLAFFRHRRGLFVSRCESLFERTSDRRAGRCSATNVVSSLQCRAEWTSFLQGCIGSSKKPLWRGQDFWVKGVVGEDHVSIFFEVTYPGYMYYVVLVP